MRESHRFALPVAVGLVGVIIGAVVTVGGLGWAPATPPGFVTFAGVNLTISYSGAWPGIYGPTHQNSCLEPTLSSVTGPRPNCPIKMTGGDQYGFGVFELGNPGNVSDVFVNVSLHSPIPVVSFFCGYGDPPPPPALNWNLSQVFPSGSGCGLGVLLTIADPAPSFPDGLWFDASMSVHVV